MWPYFSSQPSLFIAYYPLTPCRLFTVNLSLTINITSNVMLWYYQYKIYAHILRLSKHIFSGGGGSDLLWLAATQGSSAAVADEHGMLTLRVQLFRAYEKLPSVGWSPLSASRTPGIGGERMPPSYYSSSMCCSYRTQPLSFVCAGMARLNLTVDMLDVFSKKNSWRR